jgi:hypothetical protein
MCLSTATGAYEQEPPLRIRCEFNTLPEGFLNARKTSVERLEGAEGNIDAFLTAMTDKVGTSCPVLKESASCARSYERYS